MEGKEVFKHAVVNMAAVVGEVLEKAGLEPKDIDWLVPHQANIRIMQSTARRLKLPLDRLVVTVGEHGNTSAASIPLALDTAVRAGQIRPGDTVQALPGGKTSKVKAIVTADGELPYAHAGQAVTLTLEDEIDISRGDMLVHPKALPQIARQVKAHLVWMTDAPVASSTEPDASSNPAGSHRQPSWIAASTTTSRTANGVIVAIDATALPRVRTRPSAPAAISIHNGGPSKPKAFDDSNSTAKCNRPAVNTMRSSGLASPNSVHHSGLTGASARAAGCASAWLYCSGSVELGRW